MGRQSMHENCQMLLVQKIEKENKGDDSSDVDLAFNIRICRGSYVLK